MNWDLSLALHLKTNKPFNEQIFAQEMLKFWNLPEYAKIKCYGKSLFVAFFSTPEDRETVRQGPWRFDNLLVVTAEWKQFKIEGDHA